MRSAFVGPSPSVDARPRCRIVVAVLATSVALALLAGSARAESSIFDDDYTGTEIAIATVDDRAASQRLVQNAVTNSG